MPDHPNQFYYNPLPKGHVRLCILPPKGSQSYCYASLISLDIANCGTEARYNALSYVWGDATQTTFIRLSMGKRVGHLRVTKSVVDALEHARHEDGRMAFWVDQICIDQTNVREKEEQIQLMKLIYEQAGAVFAWLGQEENDSISAVASLRSGEWYDLLKPRRHDSHRIGVHDDREDEFGSDADEVERQKALTAISNLMRRPWWKRIWILQEATAQAPAQTLICCGSEQLQLSKFFDFISFLQRQTLTLDERNREGLAGIFGNDHLPMLLTFGLKRRGNTLRPLLELLENTRKLQATDARDKIYTMFPFSCEASSPECSLRVNYGQPPEQTYVEFTLRFIHQSCNLDILSQCLLEKLVFTELLNNDRLLTTVGVSHPDGSTSTGSGNSVPSRKRYIPSWVPDWRRGLDSNIFPKRERPDDVSSAPLFSANASLQLRFKLPEVDLGSVLKLKVEGLKIAKVGVVRTEEADRRSIWEHADSDYKCPLTNLSMRDVYIRTIYTDLKSTSTESGGLTWRRAKNIDEFSWPVDSSTTESMDVPDEVVVRRHVVGRRLYSTKSMAGQNRYGIVGLGPLRIEAGDELWVLSGASVPFILRPSSVKVNTNDFTLDTNTGTAEMKQHEINQSLVYEVVGETFVLGLMDGYVTELAILRRKLECLKDDVEVLRRNLEDTRIRSASDISEACKIANEASLFKMAMNDLALKLAGKTKVEELNLWALPDFEHCLRSIVLA